MLMCHKRLVVWDIERWQVSMIVTPEIWVEFHVASISLVTKSVV